MSAVIDSIRAARLQVQRLNDHNEDRVWRAAGAADVALTSASAVITELLDKLRLSERNLSSLIAAKHSDETLLSSWVDEVRKAIAMADVGR